MATPLMAVIVVFGATGAQGRSVISALQAYHCPAYHMRGLTSNKSSDAAREISSTGVEVVEVDMESEASIHGAVEGAEAVFANTAFPPGIYVSKGASAAEEAESGTALRILHALARVTTLKHLVWSTLPGARKQTGGKLHLHHFQCKVAAADFIRSKPELAKKSTMLAVGMYGSNLKNPGYVPTYDTSAKKFVVKFPIRPDASFSTIGEERKNVGIIVRAILRSGERSYEKWVIGEACKTTMSQDVQALDKVVQEQLGQETRVMYAEISLQEYETIWGPLATQIFPMFEYLEWEDNAFVDAGQDGKTVHPSDLGITSDELATVEDCLRSLTGRKFCTDRDIENCHGHSHGEAIHGTLLMVAILHRQAH